MLDHCDLASVPTSGSVGSNARDNIGLGIATLVSRANLNRVFAARCVPVEAPESPGIIGEVVGEFGDIPVAVIDSHFYFVDTSVLCPSNTSNLIDACL